MKRIFTAEEQRIKACLASKAWRKNNPVKAKILADRFNENRRKWIREHPIETIEARKRAHKKKRFQLLTLVGGSNGVRCRRCGFLDIRALQVDHVNGGGLKERKIQRSATVYYRHIQSNASNYQLLCANCNWIKKHENNENSCGKKVITTQ